MTSYPSFSRKNRRMVGSFFAVLALLLSGCGGGGGGDSPSSPGSSTGTTPIANVVPTVTGFVIYSTATTLTVPITTFTATDDSAVTGYMVTEGSTPPSASASGWSNAAPPSYTFNSAGFKTLYAWAKDASGLVSTAKTATVTITLASTTTTTTTTTTTLATTKQLLHTITGKLSVGISSSTGAVASTHDVTIKLYSDGTWTSTDVSGIGSTVPSSSTTTYSDSGRYDSGAGSAGRFFADERIWVDSTHTAQTDASKAAARFYIHFPAAGSTADSFWWRTVIDNFFFVDGVCKRNLGTIVDVTRYGPPNSATCSLTMN